MKVCTKCKIEKDFSEFTIRIDRKSGYYSSCKECCKIKSRKYRTENPDKVKDYNDTNKVKYKNYYNDNKSKILESRKLYYEENKEEMNIRNIKYYYDNRDSLIKYHKKYGKENRDKINKNKSERRKNDMVYKLQLVISSSIRFYIKKGGFKKKSRTKEIIGCDFEFLKRYIESKFESWMNWDNYGKYNGEINYGWDIDHIIPVSSAVSQEDIILLNHYSNLQPLCSKVNRDIKKDKLNYSI